MTPVQEIMMDAHIRKLKERGAVEADVILAKMVHTDQKLYEQILDSDLAYYFNELCKKAIAFDKLNSDKNVQGSDTTGLNQGTEAK
jgi:hypothetical protein